VGRGGGHGGRAEQARRAEPAEFSEINRWSLIVISLEVLYGFGALIAVVLFAYLVFALICAEEF
jgi:K+-transporting ATPase KdpF subunit